MERVSRREFAKRLAAVPIGLTAASAVLGDANEIARGQAAATQPSGTSAKKAPKSDAEYNRHAPVVEAEPFAEPLLFARNEIQPAVRPFRLDEVSLEAGPLQQAREWNRGYMMRLGNDRLLHNFRVTAALRSRAWADRNL